MEYLGRVEYQRLQNEIGIIISNFSYIENIITYFISNHYFDKLNENFISEVLEDEYFSFEIKRKIFFKIMEKYYSTQFTSFPRKELRKLQSLRNIIAHGGLQIYFENSEAKNITFRHGGKDHEANSLVRAYNLYSPKVIQALLSLPNSKKLLKFKNITVF